MARIKEDRKINPTQTIEKPKTNQFHVPTSFYAPEIHPQGDKYTNSYQKAANVKKNSRSTNKSEDLFVDRDIFFPTSSQVGISNEKLKQKIKLMKEKFESDIT